MFIWVLGAVGLQRKQPSRFRRQVAGIQSCRRDKLRRDLHTNLLHGFELPRHGPWRNSDSEGLGNQATGNSRQNARTNLNANGMARARNDEKTGPVERDPLGAGIETALRPGQFIDWRMGPTFTSDLHSIAAQIDQLATTDPGRAISLYESFLAGCYEKAEEVDDDGYFGQFVEGLYCGWVKARQGAGADPEKTASLLLDRVENDPYGYAFQLEREALKVLDKAGLATFERAVRTLFDAKDSALPPRASPNLMQEDFRSHLPTRSHLLSPYASKELKSRNCSH